MRKKKLRCWVVKNTPKALATSGSRSGSNDLRPWPESQRTSKSCWGGLGVVWDSKKTCFFTVFLFKCSWVVLIVLDSVEMISECVLGFGDGVLNILGWFAHFFGGIVLG